MADDKMFRSPQRRTPAAAGLARPGSFRQIAALALLSGCLMAAGLLAGAAALFLKYRTELPSVSQLENINPNLITRIYSQDDSLVMEFFTERRVWRAFEEIPPYVYNAVTSIEDKRFWNHWGMNLYTLPAIALKTVFLGKHLRGGSTLTQQLARNLYASIGRERKISRKIKELLTAAQIEKTYTKNDILEFYLNQVYMGAGTYGFQSAAQKYFGRSSLSALTLSEAATLAALIQKPETLRPDRGGRQTLRRRNLVLHEMWSDGFITESDYQKASAESLSVVKGVEVKGKAPYFTETVRRYLERRYGADVLYNGGLTIRTTLNFQYQLKAEALCKDWLDSLQKTLDNRFIRDLELTKRYGLPAESLRARLDYYKNDVEFLFKNAYSNSETELDSSGNRVPKLIRLALPDSLRHRTAQIAFAVLDNKTGAIKSMIGGRNFEESQFNRVTQAYRQPGSAFKPFIYTAAMDNGFVPSSVMIDQAFSIRDPMQGEWRPNNYDQTFRGEVTLRQALALSINTVAIQLQQKVGTNTVVNYAVNMGLNRSYLSPVPSLAIGACEATPLSLFSAYSAFANGGRRVEPYCVEEIFDRDDKSLETHQPMIHTVLDPKTAYIMTSLLQSVVTSGTAFQAYARGVTWPSAGKTGTTNDYSDAWFVGFTPGITCGVWTGVDEKRSLGPGMTGASAALPVWTDFMLYLYDSLKLEKENFQRPPGITEAVLCRISKKTAGTGCDSTYREIFIAGSEPEICREDHAIKREFQQNKTNLFDSPGLQKPKTEPEGKKTKVFMM